MPQRIGDEQVSKFVVNVRLRDGVIRKQSQAQRDRQNRQRQHAPARARGKSGPVRCEERSPGQSQQDENRRQCDLDEIAGAKTNWAAERQKFRLA